jgi:hypothetical protein
VWKNQDELMQARATIPEEFGKLKFVEVVFGCKNKKCRNRYFEGKNKSKGGELFGEIINTRES